MRILITGGDGFISRSLNEKLKNNFSVDCLGRKDLNLLDADKVIAYLRNIRYDVVIHAATYDAAPEHSVKDPTRVLENNMRMFFNTARCKDYFGKMIYFGSGAEFSREYWKPKMKENYFDRHVPRDQYGYSKYIMTKYALGTDNIINLRLFGVFGKYDDWRYRYIPNVCYQTIRDQMINVRKNNRFDYIYIDDLVRVVSWFIHHDPKKKVYNICTGKSYDFKTLAEIIVRTSGKNLQISVNTEKKGIEYSGDNSLLLNEMKNCAFSSIEESIKDLYEWFDRNRWIFEK